jgi:hypothetical protein
MILTYAKDFPCKNDPNLQVLFFLFFLNSNFQIFMISPQYVAKNIEEYFF